MKSNSNLFVHIKQYHDDVTLKNFKRALDAKREEFSLAYPERARKTRCRRLVTNRIRTENGRFQKGIPWKMIPDFNGEPHLAERFITLSESLITKCMKLDEDDFMNTYLRQSIICKVKGPAAEILGTQPINSWAELKADPLDNFSDRRDVWTLCQEIALMKQRHNEDGFQFYERLNKTLGLAIAYLKCREELALMKCTICSTVWTRVPTL
uniref:Uncharacterized protein n=1 Tax=Lygus hesperus TaxID=30085 RepID=A0A146LWZ6_LYGHE